MADSSVLYTAVNTDLEDAKVDLQAFEQLPQGSVDRQVRRRGHRQGGR